MHNPAQRYIQYRNKGFDHKTAKEMSGFSFIKSLGQSIFWIVVLFAALVWLSMDHREKLEEQGAYVKTLEKIVAGCVDKNGGTLTIGDEIYLCKSYPTGAKI